jgi:hypothetical protein
MKKLYFIFLLIFLSYPMFSQTTGTLLIRGQVPEILEIMISPEANSQSLDLSQSVLNLPIATITEKSSELITR